MKRTFEFVEGTSSKFWAIEVNGARTLVSFGKIGTKGQTKVKDFADEAAARRECDKLIKEKLGKGYKETTPTVAVAGPDSLRQALEQALVENPDELANHAAYADYLQEQGDVRGEFIGVQLALEDQKLKRPERTRLERRERELITRHGREWLGGLADILLDTKQGNEFRIARGWLDTVRFSMLGGFAATILAGAPQVRLLQRLLIDALDVEAGLPVGDEGSALEELDYETGCMDALAGSAHLGNVRVLRLGEDIDPDFDEPISTHYNIARGAAGLIAKLARLEELYLLAHGVETAKIFALPTLKNLRILQVYHIDEYPLEILADNPAMRNLTTLLCHPRSYSGYATNIRLEHLQALCESRYLKKLRHLRLRLTQLGDEGCAMLVESGMLKRLKILDLRLGSVTDEGAGVLADSPDLHNLELLNLSRNAMSENGISQLEATGVRLIADNQHEDDDEEDDWFCVGDIE
jgi:uncharacterized protein (TIGR02996 family)